MPPMMSGSDASTGKAAGRERESARVISMKFGQFAKDGVGAAGREEWKNGNWYCNSKRGHSLRLKRNQMSTWPKETFHRKLKPRR